MKLSIQGISDDELSKVRGIGSYCQTIEEGIVDYGQKYNLQKASAKEADYILIPNFKPYEKINFLSSRKNILVIHDLIPLKYPEHFPSGIKGALNWFVNLLTLNRFVGIITDTEIVKQEIMDKFQINSEKIKVVYPATKKIFYTSSQHPLNNELKNKVPDNFLLYVGDITWNKNLINLGKAVLKADIPLVLIGKALLDRQNLGHPEKEQFAQFLKLAKNNKNFIFLGYVNDFDLLTLYQNSQAVILPSYDEGFGLPWLEGALQNKPVIISDLPIIQEITKKTAIYFNPDDYLKLASLMQNVYHNEFDFEKLKLQKELAYTYTQESMIKNLTYTFTNF